MRDLSRRLYLLHNSEKFGELDDHRGGEVIHLRSRSSRSMPPDSPRIRIRDRHALMLRVSCQHLRYSDALPRGQHAALHRRAQPPSWQLQARGEPSYIDALANPLRELADHVWNFEDRSERACEISA